MSFDLRTRGLDQLVVLHTGRTRRQACHTTEAGIEMAGETVAEGRLTLQPYAHQVNATARRVHLFAPEDIGWTDGQTEATVDTVGDQITRRWMVARRTRLCKPKKVLPQVSAKSDEPHNGFDQFRRIVAHTLLEY